MTTTLITDGFDGEDEDFETRLDRYLNQQNKQMTDVAKVLNQARLVYRIKERNG